MSQTPKAYDKFHRFLPVGQNLLEIFYGYCMFGVLSLHFIH